MITPGKIVIKEKVYFEYYKLPTPKVKDFKKIDFDVLTEYEASKRVIEVENVIYDDLIEHIWLINMDSLIIPKNNTPCEAEVENNVATIIKIN